VGDREAPAQQAATERRLRPAAAGLDTDFF
jgi:hypothetical protein